MALFTDGTISNVEDLLGQDTAILGLAGTEGIDLTNKMVLAREELGVQITNLLQRAWSSDPITLGNVVVTAPLRLWHTYQTLALVYRDAFHNQLNDRYKGRWDEYQSLAKWASGMVAATGLGIVWDPIPQARPPELSLVAGTQAAATYYVKTSWTNVSGEEGQPSNAAYLTAPGLNNLQVKPLSPPARATGWNIYLGFSSEALTRQNSAPLPLTQNWVQAAAVSTDGKQPGNGQEPNKIRVLPRIIQRG